MMTPSRPNVIALTLVCAVLIMFCNEQSAADIGQYMLVWQVAGPYSADQQTGESLLDTPFSPEQAPDSTSILWRAFQI